MRMRLIIPAGLVSELVCLGVFAVSVRAEASLSQADLVLDAQVKVERQNVPSDTVMHQSLEHSLALVACVAPEQQNSPPSGDGASLTANQTRAGAANASLHGARFDEAMTFVLPAEGGYSNHPADSGGATNRGITTGTYDTYRKNKGLPTCDVREITDDELIDIYYLNYWVPSGAEDLDRLTAIVHFDAAVNCGLSGAARLLAQAQNGFRGSDAELAERYLKVRQEFYNKIVERNASQNVFLKGWTNRVNNLRKYVAELPSSPATTPPKSPTATFDGTTPAAGVSNTCAWVPALPAITGDVNNRNPGGYDNVINQFAVGANPRYAPRHGNTYCNIFVWDVTSAMNAEIPHWVDANGAPVKYGHAGKELNANDTVLWLQEHGRDYGWRKVGAEEAQRLANLGHPAVVVWNNPGGIGHVAIVRPGQIDTDGPAMAQAGAKNFNIGHVYPTFQRAGDAIQYWVNDQGTAICSQNLSCQPAAYEPSSATLPRCQGVKPYRILHIRRRPGTSIET